MGHIGWPLSCGMGAWEPRERAVMGKESYSPGQKGMASGGPWGPVSRGPG